MLWLTRDWETLDSSAAPCYMCYYSLKKDYYAGSFAIFHAS